MAEDKMDPLDQVVSRLHGLNDTTISNLLIADMIRPNNIYQEDCIPFMQRMKEENMLADVVVRSPPYNIGKNYGTYNELDRYHMRVSV